MVLALNIQKVAKILKLNTIWFVNGINYGISLVTLNSYKLARYLRI